MMNSDRAPKSNEAREACVYRILNMANGKHYIGSSRRHVHRWRNHRARLRAGKHESLHLQSAWNKYGESNFAFEVLETVDANFLAAREQFWIWRTGADSRRHGYNMAAIVGAVGYTRPATVRAAIGIANRGQKRSAEQRARMSQACMGRKATVAARAAISTAHKGRTGNKNNAAKPVLQLSLSGEVIARYEACSEAASAMGCSRGALANALAGRSKTAAGYRWTFAKERQNDK